MFGLDCQLQFMDSLSVWAGLFATVPGFQGVWAGLSAKTHGFPECLGWTVSYSTCIPGVFGLDCQLKYLYSRSIWAGLSAVVPGFSECLGWTVSYSTWIPRVFGLDCQLQYLDSRSVWLDGQLQYLDSQSVWAGLSATVPGVPECLGWTVSYSTWIRRVFGLDC